MTKTRAANLTAERLVANVDQGTLDCDTESWMPLDLFGPPTADETASAARSADSEARSSARARHRRNGAPAVPAAAGRSRK